MTDIRPRCLHCGKLLTEIRYPTGSPFNRDQWDSMRAGDWVCESCPGNERGQSGMCYFWAHELNRGDQCAAGAVAARPEGGRDERIAELEAKLGQVREVLSWLEKNEKHGEAAQHGDEYGCGYCVAIDEVEEKLRAALAKEE